MPKRIPSKPKYAPRQTAASRKHGKPTRKRPAANRQIVVPRLPRFAPAARQSQATTQTFTMVSKVVGTTATPNPLGTFRILPHLFSGMGGFPYYQVYLLKSIAVEWKSTFGMARPGTVATLFEPDCEQTGTPSNVSFETIMIEPRRNTSFGTLYLEHKMLYWKADAAYSMPYDRFLEGTTTSRDHWASTVDPVLHWAVDSNVPNSAEEVLGRIQVTVVVEFRNLVFPAAPVTGLECSAAPAAPQPDRPSLVSDMAAALQ